MRAIVCLVNPAAPKLGTTARRLGPWLLALLAGACSQDAPEPAGAPSSEELRGEAPAEEVPFEYGPIEQWSAALAASPPIDLDAATSVPADAGRPLAAEDVLYRFDGDAAGDWFGWAAAALDDLDGDGVEDFAIGAHQNESFGPRPAPDAPPGYVVVYSGATGAELYRLHSSGSLHTDGSDDHFGYSLTSTVDMDADGIGDIAVGAYLYDSGDDDPESVDENTGGVQIFSGKSGALLHTMDGFAWGDRFGFLVTTLPDMDADGKRDLLIGVQKAESGPENAGCLQAYSSATLEMLGSVYGPGEEGHLGTSTTDVGDLDGDGMVDIAGGAFKYCQPGDDRFEIGAAAVFNGRTGEVFFAWQGQRRLDGLGYSMARLGDVDGDGRGELLIGAPQSDWLGHYAGPGYVRLQSCTGGETLAVLSGARTGDQFGWSVAVVGDRDGDGIDDFSVGAPASVAVVREGTLDRRGTVYLFSGATRELLLAREGLALNDQFGQNVTLLGDLDGDGSREVLVGAPENVPGQTRPGYAVVVRGSALDVR